MTLKSTVATAAIPYLVTLWTTALSATPMVVADGSYTSDLPNQLLCVGFNDQDNVPIIAGNQSLSDDGNNWRDDVISIQNQMSVAAGDDFASTRNTAAAALDIVFDAVINDRQLGTTIDPPGFAFPGTYTFRQGWASNGERLVIVDFEVAILVKGWGG